MTARNMTVRSTIAAALAIGLMTSACGLQGEPQAEALQDVQYELLSTTTSTTSTTVPERPVFAVLFYWHTAVDSRLQSISRPKEERPTAAQTLRELVLGPLPEDLETNSDLKNFLDPSMEPQLSQIEGATYQIQIQWPLDEPLSTEQAAELVCTATQFPEIDAVTIVNSDGAPFTLSGTGAVAIVGPAEAEDFGDCREDPLPVEADPETETTTTTS